MRTGDEIAQKITAGNIFWLHIMVFQLHSSRNSLSPSLGFQWSWGITGFYFHKVSFCLPLSLQVGAVGLLIMGIIATHCMCQLVACARELCRRYCTL